MTRFANNRVAKLASSLVAIVALSGEPAFAAEPCDGIWVEPFSCAYAIAGGQGRLVAGAGFPATDRFAIDVRALAEWFPDPDAGFFQIKADALARWYATGLTTGGGNRRGPYLALGAGVGYATLSGNDTVRIVAGGPVAEAGFRMGIGPLPAFAEPFVGYSLSAGPRFGGGDSRFASGDGRFLIAGGANAGLRLGWSLNRPE